MFKKMVIKEMVNKLSIKDLTEFIEIVPIEEQYEELIGFVKDIIKHKENKK